MTAETVLNEVAPPPDQAPDVTPESALAALRFRLPFRRYQQAVFEKVAEDGGDRRYHIVAPPGAGKTVVGLELVRRFGAPAVVFAPTSTIQRQWIDTLDLFTDEPGRAMGLVSSDPHRLAPINVFTYHLLAAPAEAHERIREIARRRWVAQLARDGHAADEADAYARVAAIEARNPKAFGRELARHGRAAKRDLLRDGENVAQFLHPNALALIESLVAAGVCTVVLDECHHLLAYWPIVIRHLIGRIGGAARVVGLTATLPDPENEEQHENYAALLGEVDFEVPTPAVVREGELAPYRDLVYFVEPTPREQGYLRNIQGEFGDTVGRLTADDAFRTWVADAMLGARAAPGSPPETAVEVAGTGQAQTRPIPAVLAWQEQMRARPAFALAALRFLWHIRHPEARPLAWPVEAYQEPEWDDWIALIERYALDRLTPSRAKDEHALLARLRRALKPFGFTLTERGVRQGRSPGDLILSYSEAKATAAGRLLGYEHAALGPLLRAVVVTDFERSGAGIAGAQEALADDAGSARRVFRALVERDDVRELRPMLVTGQTLWATSEAAPDLVAGFNANLRARGGGTTCAARPTELADVVEIAGQGPGWTSGAYVRLVTAAFERGETRCLVGTRGIFGEGWDALALNTLIDLTSATTSTSVQQLRGRTLRLDPAWPRKVAHNWDVVCVAPEFDRGDRDLRRFEQRHARYWGLAEPEVVAAASQPPCVEPARIVRGVAHVDPMLADELAFKPFAETDYRAFSALMVGRIASRERSYEEWGIGEPYEAETRPVVRAEAHEVRVRTVYTVEMTLCRLVRALGASLLAAFGVALYRGLVRSALGLATHPGALDAMLFTLVLGAALASVARNAWKGYRLVRALFDEHPEAILLDVGRALIGALRECGLAGDALSPETLRVVTSPDGTCELRLDGAPAADAATFAGAYRQIFALIRDQRYLILRDDAEVPDARLRPLWRLLRRGVRERAGYPPAYYAVPQILAGRRAAAECFARHWRESVGGGTLVYTRGADGWRRLLEARAQRRPPIACAAFEVWR